MAYIKKVKAPRSVKYVQLAITAWIKITSTMALSIRINVHWVIFVPKVHPTMISRIESVQLVNMDRLKD